MKRMYCSRTAGVMSLAGILGRAVLLAAVVFPFSARAEASVQTVSAPASSNICISAGASSFFPQFSRDKDSILFLSHANNIVTNDDRAPWTDVFVGKFYSLGLPPSPFLVSVNTNGVGGGNADAYAPTISSNGQFVAFV